MDLWVVELEGGFIVGLDRGRAVVDPRAAFGQVGQSEPVGDDVAAGSRPQGSDRPRRAVGVG